ncbi:polyadenylate-binding protein-interacting protein 3-like isoform X2 [Magnolia sinica]|uniref:polyadenylate-binding protein-interacting protein 3-like isoform X2 n=1 Tax=Magnolia sinica TaxID=86752 RepID=UPI00265A0BBA|nr:polyadenylate-binding protein-interacting protein 3-like isoform X2 [Magnolia sinica]
MTLHFSRFSKLSRSLRETYSSILPFLFRNPKSLSLSLFPTLYTDRFGVSPPPLSPNTPIISVLLPPSFSHSKVSYKLLPTMSLQQVVQPRSNNSFGRRRGDREMGTRLDRKSSGSFSNSVNGSKFGGFESPSRDRLVYVTTCFIGHHVEVQMKNGSIFSGIFHAMSTEKDFGIILKMARLTKDGSSRGQKPIPDSVIKAPSKTLIIPSKEYVQVIAKDLALTADGFANGHAQEKRQDIMIDSYISQSNYVEVERELERWTPDKDDPNLPELENIFDGTWNRNWDQFETNEALFGVKSTFDEELYTTKLERGPQMRELEREALRIAREIEGEETQDIHLAEERGIHFNDDDEESRFSSVFRGVDDGRYEENEDMVLNDRNSETFGDSSASVTSRSFSDVARGKNNDGTQPSSSCSSVDGGTSSQIPAVRDLYRSGSGDHVRELSSDCASNDVLAVASERRMNECRVRDQHGGKSGPKESTERNTVSVEAQTSKSEEMQHSVNLKKASFDKGGLSPRATAYAPSSIPTKSQEPAVSARESTEHARTGKDATQSVNPHVRPGSSTSSTSERVVATSVSSGPALSPSSSVGSLSSEKSTLNPFAKEFKLNPNAKSFIPSQASLRPPSPASEGSFYFPTNMSAVPHMHGLPVGIGIGPSFGGHQPVIYNPQAAPVQSPQAYVHPNGPLYGQQMIIGQPRQVLYMPSYPPEMQYKGRDF